jgi:hypothetical protein
VPLVRRFVLALGIIGFAFFGLAFLASIANPGFVEQVARDIIRYEIERKVHERIEALDSHFLASKAAAFSKSYADEIARTKQFLAEQLPARLATVISEMQNLDCECRKKIEASIRVGLEGQIGNASAAQEHLTSLIRAKYMETANQVTREFRIFTGTNAFVFALLLSAVLLKRRADLHLLPSALVLFAAASVTAYLYLFNQNWLHTLVFSDYVGFAYLGYLAGAFAFLSDVVFNRGRITAEALNVVLNAVGSALQVAPC